MLKFVYLVYEYVYDENKSKFGEYFEVFFLYLIGEKIILKLLCI